MERINFKKINLRKILPGFVSILLVLIMGFQTLATNVDLEAFVKLEDYERAYYETNWRIDDLDDELERLYKFTCSNVKSFGGVGDYSGVSDIIFNWRNPTQSYTWWSDPIADLSEEGYLRFNAHGALNAFGGHNKVDRWEFKIPASRCGWHEGIDPAPNCSILVRFTRTFPNTTSRNQVETGSIVEVIMGPFKKFPKFTSTGSTKTTGLIVTTDRTISANSTTPSSFYYAYNQTELPATWSSDATGRIFCGSTSSKGSNSSYSTRTAAEFEADPYNKENGRSTGYFTMSALPTVDLSQYENVWIRAYINSSSTNPYLYYSGFSNSTITTWNHDR